MLLQEKIVACAEILDDDVVATIYDSGSEIAISGEEARRAVNMLRRGWRVLQALEAAGVEVPA